MYQVPMAKDGNPVRAIGADGAPGAPRYQFGGSWPLAATSAEFAALSELRLESMDLLAAQAEASLSINIEMVVVRDIQPHTDLGNATYDYWGGVSPVANTWTDYINKSLAGIQQVYGFFGIEDITPNPQVRALQFYRGAKTALLGQYQVESAYGFNMAPAALIRPTIVYFPNDTIEIQMLATGTQQDVLVPLGYVAEKVGTKVNPQA